MPPYRGVSDNTPYGTTQPDTVPPERMINMRPYGTDTKRPRVGTRPGLKRLFPTQLGNGKPVQCIRSVTRASGVSGYRVGSCEAIAGTSRPSVDLQGHVWLFDDVPSMEREYFLDATALFFGASGQSSCVDCAIHPSLSRVAGVVNIGSGVSASGNIEAMVQVYDLDGSSQAIWHIYDSGGDRFSNAIAFSDDYLFVTINNTVRVYSAQTPTTAVADVDLNGWSQEVTGLAVWKDPSGQEFLYCCFLGTEAAATLASGTTVEAGISASHFRAGIMRFRINATGAPLTQVTYGTQLDSSDTYYDDNGTGSPHGYFRFSEQTAARPYGCYPTGIAVARDGSVIVSRTNQGYGPNTTSFSPTIAQPYISVMRIEPDGSYGWEADTFSHKTSATHGFNDIHNPSLNAVAIDSTGDAYVGGRASESGECAFRIDRTTGAVIWGAVLQTTSVSEAIRQNGVGVDPRDDAPMFFGDRNTSWTGAAGRDAHGWKLDPVSAGVRKFFDLGTNVSGLGVSHGQGRMAYSTDYVA